jgi:hypothetical protein
MGWVIASVVLAIIAKAIFSGAGNPATLYDNLLSKGIPARGILLEVARTGTKVGTVRRRFERRTVTLDVEIPGQAPFALSTRPVIPINLVRDILPGSTVELRIDPKKASNIAIIGPGTGFVPTGIKTS